MALEVAAKPPSGADVHTNPPVKTFEHSQRARCADVAGSCRLTSLHDPRAHEQRYVMRIGSSFNKQAARPTGRCESEGGCGVSWRTSRTVPSSVMCSRPLPASSWISEREGRWCEGKHDKKSSGKAGGRPRAMYRMAAWHAGSSCCSLAQSACE